MTVETPSSVPFSIDGWSYVLAREVLRTLGANATLAETWDQFVLAEAPGPGILGHAIVVAVVPRGTASPMLALLRGVQKQPFHMSCRVAADEGYLLLTPHAVASQCRKVKEDKDAARNRQDAADALERAEFQTLLDNADVGLKEKELARLAYQKYGLSASNLRIRRVFRSTHCMHCREGLDGRIHVLQCKSCTAIVCPTCGSCGCGDSRFLKAKSSQDLAAF
jgi:hypothetical protein